jgi:hypothetical protein
MGVVERIRRMTSEQREALRALDQDERNAIELEELETEHIVVEDAYLRRRDRLLGREVPDVYAEIESARSLLAQASRERQKKFERMRMVILCSPPVPRAAEPTQLGLLSSIAVADAE